jgi:hypothetical protein
MSRYPLPALAMLSCLALPVGAQAPAATDLSRLAWLEGRWTGTQGGLETEEHWTSPSGNALVGMNKAVKAGRIVSFEFLRIQHTKEGTAYLASPGGAPPTAFVLVELGDARVVFQNEAHDFPQRILYWLDAAGALHARIEGTIGGKARSQEWTWTKAR